MPWAIRNGKRVYYESRRVHGKPTKVYRRVRPRRRGRGRTRWSDGGPTGRSRPSGWRPSEAAHAAARRPTDRTVRADRLGGRGRAGAGRLPPTRPRRDGGASAMTETDRAAEAQDAGPGRAEAGPRPGQQRRPGGDPGAAEGPGRASRPGGRARRLVPARPDSADRPGRGARARWPGRRSPTRPTPCGRSCWTRRRRELGAATGRAARRLLDRGPPRRRRPGRPAAGRTGRRPGHQRPRSSGSTARTPASWPRRRRWPPSAGC